MNIIYNYITTNIIDGKQYIGMHSTDNIDDGYLGSGKYLLSAIKKYGKENFERNIICFCETELEAHDNETILINLYNTLTPNGYNLSPKGGFGYIGSLSKESIEKMRKSKLGQHHNEEAKIKIGLSSKGRIHSKETIEKFVKKVSGDNHWTRRLGVSLETRIKQSKSNIGKNLGKVRTEEYKEKSRLRNLGKKASEETKEKMRQRMLKWWDIKRKNKINNLIDK